MPLNHATYIHARHVKGFIGYLSDVISGNTCINFTVGFSRGQLPVGYEEKFPGYVGARNGGNAVYVVFAQKLEHLFNMYWWNKLGYNYNKLALDAACEGIKLAIKREDDSEHQKFATEACAKVMEWGFGKNSGQYTDNMRWANNLGERLSGVLRTGRESLYGEEPNIDAFGVDPNNQPKMNAGWTKYYALALPNHIIYDGRVGAALGFLVRRYLESLPQHEKLEYVPEELKFLWANGKGGNTLRDPSSAQHKFGKLYGGNYGSKAWARINVQANWILSAAVEGQKTAWCSGDNGLRPLEAALFMLGYDLSRADEHNPILPHSAS